MVVASLFAAGCEDETDTTPARNVSAETPKPASLPRIKWLDLRDPTAPERWLASREAKADLDDDAPGVVALRTDLALAAQRFREPPRMIANRAVQLEEMLAAMGIVEHAPELVVLLSSAVTDGRPHDGFGAIAQHYYNLRKQGLDRETALAQLKETSLLDTQSIRRG